jgi:hypothetical protein
MEGVWGRCSRCPGSPDSPRARPRQAVILLLDHGREGTQGLILNKRTEHRLRDVLGAEMLCPEFTDNPLYLVRSCRLNPNPSAAEA